MTEPTDTIAQTFDRLRLASWIPAALWSAGVLVLLLTNDPGALGCSKPATGPSVVGGIASLTCDGGAVPLIAFIGLTVLAALLMHPLHIWHVNAAAGNAAGVRPIMVLKRRWRERRADSAAQKQVVSEEPAGRDAASFLSTFEALSAEHAAGSQRAKAAAQAARRSRRLKGRTGSALRATVFGTALADAVQRAGRPYGLTRPDLLESRLLACSNDEINARVTAARSTVELYAGLAIYSATLPLMAVPLLGDPLDLLLGAVAVPLVLSFLFSRAGATACAYYGEALGEALDLHRVDLLVALHLQVPDRAGEKATWQMVEAFVNNRRTTAQLPPYLDEGQPLEGAPLQPGETVPSNSPAAPSPNPAGGSPKDPAVGRPPRGQGRGSPP